MIDFLTKTICLAAMVLSIAVFLFPADVASAAGIELAWPVWIIRGIAILLLFVSFTVFSGPSKFEVEDEPETSDTSVRNLLSAIQRSEADLIASVSKQDLDEVVRNLNAGKKIAAIKSLRVATSCGLKEAKEAVEHLQAEMAKTGRTGSGAI